MVERNYIVTKSNKLISANYDLSLQEQKIILTLASMVQPHDTEFKEYEFKIKDFITLLGIEDKKKYIEIPKLTKDLMKKVFEIREGRDILQLAWLSSARYKTGEGTLILRFSPDLKPYMLELKELYTSYKLENILSLKSKYSIRIYEILKSNLYKNNVEIQLEELKKMVGATASYFKVYADFRVKALAKAQKELKEKTDISFDYEEIKTGRKVTSIKFKIKQSNSSSDEIAITATEKIDKQQSIDDISSINIVKSIIDNINDDGAKAILNIANGDINKIKEKYSLISKFKTINNLTGAMIQAIKEDWKATKVVNSKFNNFQERDYDYDELEKKLLGWDKE